MRCLYCGKELALLKRWTGGEFCSDGHRRRYQEEYNELALKRLLQAKPLDQHPDDESALPQIKALQRGIASADHESPARPANAAVPSSENTPRISLAGRFNEVPRVSETPQVDETPRDDAPPSHAVIHAAVVDNTEIDSTSSDLYIASDIGSDAAPSERRVTSSETEATAPAELTGFVIDLPDPWMSIVAAMAEPQMEFVGVAEPSLPGGFSGSSKICLAEAGPAALQPSSRFFDSPSRPHACQPESREFRMSPVTESRLPPTHESHLDIAVKAMETTIASCPPQTSPALWQASEQEHSPWALELGALSRLGFTTTGLDDEADSEEKAPRPIAALEPLAVEAGSPARPEKIVPIEPEQVEVQPAPILMEAANPPTIPEPRDLPAPQMISTPMPLTVHGLTPGKPKLAQVFTTALAGDISVQPPPSEGLPLRPLMIFGPAPETTPASAEPVETAAVVGAALTEIKPTEIKPESEPNAGGRNGSKKSNGGPRSGNGKQRRSDVRIFEPELAREVATPESKFAEIAPRANVSSPVAIAAGSVTPIQDRVAPTVAAPTFGQRSDADLGLPALKGSSDSFWSRIPIPVMLGLAAAGVVAIGLAVYFDTRGSEVVVPQAARTVVAGPPLDLGVAGWIANFTGEPAGPRARQISVLRGSLTLTDFRLEFQGVIENKSLGWVLRARDPKNFYVMKLETVKPGLNPDVALVRFGVANGEELARTVVPLPMRVRGDTVYKVRVDAVGNRLTTWVQDQKIDEWSDTRINAGGVGLYYERGERGKLERDFTISPLSTK